MKKILIGAVAALAFTGVAFAQEVTVAFENELSSDIVSISDGSAEFAGFSNQVTVELESEKVNAGVSLITEFGKNDDDKFGLTDYEIESAYVEFTPVEMLSIDFNSDCFTPGSYLPVADDNVGNGDIGSKLAVIVRPIENLSVGAGINLPSVFGESEDKVDINAGVDYTTESFSVGAALRSPINNLGFGVFGSYTGVENLTVNLGFSYNDDFCDVAGNLLTLGASYEFSIITLNLDCVTNFGADGNDLYSGLGIEASVTDSLTIAAQGTINMDFEDTSSTVSAIEASAAYAFGNHELSAGVAVEIADSTAISFPISYKYSF